jgi:serine/threonine protein kinase
MELGDDSQSRSLIRLPILAPMANAPMLSVVRDQTRPRKLGRYELEESLGAGDGLETFRARVRGLAGFDRIFAVKCLHRPRGSQVNLNDPYIKTARRLAGINDPRIARVLDADVIDGLAVAVTEFVHGLDIDRFRECAQFAGVLATGGDETAEKWQKIVAYIGAETAGGLAVMHALTPPLVHAALSPRNIIATARGGIKLLDAGLAYAATPDLSSRRSLAYADPAALGVEPSSHDDMRAFGAILFELATGELPAQGATSAMARRALDALWPSMADFIAGLLSEDPSLRPTASEAARILADYWSEIPDASMVAEIAGLVRNLSAFVVDAGLQTTAPPILQEPPPRQEPPPMAARAEALSSTPPPPPAATSPVPPPPPAPAQPRSTTSFQDEPTVVRSTSNYAAALFQAAPSDSDLLPPDEALAEPIEPLLAELGEPPGHATLMAYPAVDHQAPPGDEPFPAVGSDPAPMFVEATDQVEIYPSELDPSSAPLPEVGDWGARALAALGDQAGVSILAPSPPPPTAPRNQPPPPPVSDPAIEEAFAFAPAAPGNAVMAEVEATAEGSESPGLGQAPGMGSPLLEEELLDDGQGEGIAREQAEPADIETGAAEFGPESSPVLPADQIAPLAATAFEDDAEAQTEWAPSRPAHAMSTPEEDGGRGVATREAAKSSESLGEVDVADIFADSGRKRRIAVGIVVVALVCGAVAGALTAFGFFGGGRRPIIGKSPTKPAALAGAPARPPLATGGPAGSTPAASPTAAPTAKPAPAPVQASRAAPPSAKAAKVDGKSSTSPVPAVAKETAGPSHPAMARAEESTAAARASKPTVPDQAATGAATVSISVTSRPAGAAVWINGEERGTTPCTVRLPRGNARLTLVRAGHLSHTSTVEAAEGKSIDETLQAALPPLAGEARFRAECKTQGKLPIVVDGRETGVLCPYSKLRVDPGAHVIGLLVPATGKVHTKEITLVAGVRSIVFAD